jgi:hypothetical protein
MKGVRKEVRLVTNRATHISLRVATSPSGFRGSAIKGTSQIGRYINYPQLAVCGTLRSFKKLAGSARLSAVGGRRPREAAGLGLAGMEDALQKGDMESVIKSDG